MKTQKHIVTFVSSLMLIFFSSHLNGQASCKYDNDLGNTSITAPLYNAYNSLVSNGQISGGAPIVFEAGNHICMDNGFYAPLGSDFLAHIASCLPDYPIIAGHPLENRIVRISTNFLVAGNLDPALQIMTDAANSCFNGILLSDVKFGYLQDMPPSYFQNLKVFLDSAKALGMKVIPDMAPFGYSQPILYHNPNLAESLPVVQAPFIVANSGGSLHLENDPADSYPLLNGDFEQTASNNDFPGWGYQDDPGIVTFWDTNESYNGNASARITDPNGNGRIFQEMSVSSFRDYHLQFWVKTDNLNSGYTNVYIANSDNGRVLNHNSFTVATTQGWTEYNFTFNTLDATNITMAFGVWGGTTGSIWFDNININPTRLNNIVRRSTTPIVVETANGTTLTEGLDFDFLEDPLMGNDPYSGSFSIWHNQPQLGIPASSSLNAGDIVYLSYFHAGIVNNGQVTASLTETEVLDIVEGQFNDIKAAFDASNIFDSWMFGHDEIRVGAWDNSPSFGSPGENLAWNINQVRSRARSISQDADLFTWSDMFDPNHNAYNDPGDPYYLVNGSYHESWLGLASDINIFNWNFFNNRIQSAQHFADRGHNQILAGFYDDNNYYTPSWLTDLQGIDGIRGVMYTTWENDFSKMQDWANVVFGGCNFSTSTNEVENIKRIKVFPNPTDGYINIEIPDQNEIMEISILDTKGKLVWKTKSLDKHIELENIQSGLYTVKVTTEDHYYSTKVFIK